LPSQVKGARTQPYQEWLRNAKLRTSSRRGSWVQIPPPAPITNPDKPPEGRRGGAIGRPPKKNTRIFATCDTQIHLKV